MNAGRMIHRVDIQQASLGTAGDTGEQAETWTSIRTGVPAQIQWLGGNEAFRAKSVNPEATALITLRYDPDINPSVRFKYGSEYFYPLSVVPNGTQWLDCTCKEQL